MIGVPHEKWGETVKALVVLVDGADDHRTRAHRVLQVEARRLQVPDVGGVPHRARPDRDRQAAEVQAARAVLDRHDQEGELRWPPQQDRRDASPQKPQRRWSDSGDWLDFGAGLAQPDAFERRSGRADRRSPQREHPRMSEHATAAASAGRSRARACVVLQLAPRRLRPQAVRRRVAELHPVQPRRDPRLLPALHRPAGRDGGQDVSCRCPRILQLQRGEPLARRGRVASEDRRSSRSTRRLPYVHGIDNGLHISQVDYVIDGDGPAVAGATEPRTDRRRSDGREADRRRDRGRRVPADRHRRHAERRVLAADGERRTQPRRPHRDAHRRHHRSVPSRCHHRVEEDGASRQDRVHVRPRFASRRTTRSTTTPTSRANRST